MKKSSKKPVAKKINIFYPIAGVSLAITLAIILYIMRPQAQVLQVAEVKSMPVCGNTFKDFFSGGYVDPKRWDTVEYGTISDTHVNAKQVGLVQKFVFDSATQVGLALDTHDTFTDSYIADVTMGPVKDKSSNSLRARLVLRGDSGTNEAQVIRLERSSEGFITAFGLGQTVSIADPSPTKELKFRFAKKGTTVLAQYSTSKTGDNKFTTITEFNNVFTTPTKVRLVTLGTGTGTTRVVFSDFSVACIP